MSAQDAAIVISACSAAFVAVTGVFLKFLLQTRQQATSANHAVNGRANDEPTLRDVVDAIAWETERHTKKLDLLGDAIAGANNRLDALEADAQEG